MTDSPKSPTTSLAAFAGSDRGGLYKIDQSTTVWVLSLLPIIYAAFTISFYDAQYMKTFALSLILAIILYKSNEYLIPQCKELLLNAGLGGKDLNKPGELKDKKPMFAIVFPQSAYQKTPNSPESMGIITGATFLIAGVTTQLFYTSSPTAVTFHFFIHIPIHHR